VDPYVIALGVLLVLVAGAAGWLVGRRPTRTHRGGLAEPARLGEYDFYPFRVDAGDHVEFNPDAFDVASAASRASPTRWRCTR